MAKTERTYVHARLAEIHTNANKAAPPMGYWKALWRASRRLNKSHADSRVLPDLAALS